MNTQKQLLATLLTLSALLAGCASTAGVAGDTCSPSACSAPTAAAARTDGIRTPYGFTYRVGLGYAYRPWTW